MSRSRQYLLRSSRAALIMALCNGVSQGVAVIAGYVTGLEARALVVFALVGITYIVALAPAAARSLKKSFTRPIIPAVRADPIVGTNAE
jgi:hypothetical protein